MAAAVPIDTTLFDTETFISAVEHSKPLDMTVSPKHESLILLLLCSILTKYSSTRSSSRVLYDSNKKTASFEDLDKDCVGKLSISKASQIMKYKYNHGVSLLHRLNSYESSEAICNLRR